MSMSVPRVLSPSVAALQHDGTRGRRGWPGGRRETGEKQGKQGDETGNRGNGNENRGTPHFHMWKRGGNRGTPHFHMWKQGSRFPELRFEIISARTTCYSLATREIGSVSLFRFKSFEISEENHLCRHSHKASHFRIGRRERCLDSRSVELAMRFTTASLRNTLCRSGYVLKRSSKILHHG